MLGFRAFSTVEKSVVDSIKSPWQKGLLGAHDAALQVGNMAGYSKPMVIGGMVGSGVGAADGAFSYDSSILGGAFRGAVLGTIGGAGLKFAANSYASGAVRGFKVTEGGTDFITATGNYGVSGKGGTLRSAWDSGNTAGVDGAKVGAFNPFSNISRGFND